MKTTEPKTTKQFTLTIDVESNRSADDTVTLFQKFFDFYHPSLKAKVRKQVAEAKAEAYAEMQKAGVMTRDEVISREKGEELL